jgi:hypothetical protein
MIHHVSISAKNPQHVAAVLAEVMEGKSYPFPGAIPDSFMAVEGDGNGTMVEVYPENMTLKPGSTDDQEVQAKRSASVPEAWPFHFLLSVRSDRATIERIGAREGWTTRYLGRGAPGQPPVFHVIEFWIENRLMVEVVTKEMAAEYTALMQPAKLDALMAARRAA